MGVSEEYVWVHMETSFLSMLNTVIEVYPKLSPSQHPFLFLVPKTIMAYRNQLTEVKLSSKLYSSDK